MRRGLLLLIAAGCAGADRDPGQALARLREIVVDRAKRIPNYTCVQTIDRRFFTPRTRDIWGTTFLPQGQQQSCDQISANKRKSGFSLTPTNSDRFRLEVWVGAGAEMYSWVGASRFTDRPLRELIGEGPSSTGAFGPMLTNVFSGDAGEFKFEGEKTVGGKRSYAYSFRVSAERSHHSFLGRGGSESAIAYEGTVFADPETGTPLQLTLFAGALPAGTGCCEFTAVLDYSPVRIDAAEFLLPKTALQSYTMADGREVENTVTFSACREYLAKSIVNYETATPPGPAASGSPRQPSSLNLPARLPVAIALVGTVDSDVAAVGDPFRGRIVDPLLDKRKSVIVPSGAIVHGRIARSARSLSPARLNISLTVETVEIGGREVPFQLTGKRERMPALPANRGFRPRGDAIGELPRRMAEGGVAVQREGRRVVLRDGFRTEWVTLGQP